jgi:hypothetical protein
LVDRVVVDSMRRRLGHLVFENLGPSSTTGKWESAWGFDETSQTIWLPDGRTVDLSSKPVLSRLVQEMLERMTATKEELFKSVWNQATYHPSRHDPRVHMSIRKVREAVEEDPGNPLRIVTTDDGYRVQGIVRRVRAR